VESNFLNDGARYCQCDHYRAYLCNVDEAYCGWDLVPCDFYSGDGVSQLLGDASTHTHEGAVTVDPRRRRVGTKATRR
jgi:hypothetical protein